MGPPARMPGGDKAYKESCSANEGRVAGRRWSWAEGLEVMGLEQGLPHANPEPLPQELQQDLASDCLLFSQVHPGPLAPGPILPTPRHHLLRRVELGPRGRPMASLT